MKYGYLRVSTPRQIIGQQRKAIEAQEPGINKYYEEVYTGAELDRPEFVKLRKAVKPGDTIYFYSVSRMARNAEEGIALYDEWYQQGVDLVFINEPHINTKTFRDVKPIPKTGEDVDVILTAVDEYLRLLRHKQIEIAFQQAEKELKDIRERTRLGLKEHGACNLYDEDGNLIEQGKISKALTGKDYAETDKAKAAKKIIRKHFKAYGGTLNAKECAKQAGISRTTFYQYLSEMGGAEQ